jgi:hypothetical protein
MNTLVFSAESVKAHSKDALKLSAVADRTSGCARRRLTRAWNRT